MKDYTHSLIEVIGVVGNRDGFSYLEVKHELDKYPEIEIIVTGGAYGVDSHAMRYAKERGLCLIVFYPDLSIGSPKCYFKRNEQIVNFLARTNLHNMLIAFNKKKHSGTTNTINIAKKYGIGLKVIT